MRLGDTKFFNLFALVAASTNPDRTRDVWQVGQLVWTRERTNHKGPRYSFQIEVDTLHHPGRRGWTLLAGHETMTARGRAVTLPILKRTPWSQSQEVVLGSSQFGYGDKMNIRVISAVFTGFLLCGCTDADWDYATTYVGLGSADQAAPPRADPAEATTVEVEAAPTSTPAAQASPSDNWCQQIAKAEGADAANNGFDAATQRRRAETTYRQCLASSGSAPR